MSESYRTLAGRGEAVVVEKKSRFIGVAAPVDGVDEALLFLDGVRKAHPEAGHNVYAYVLGTKGENVRRSDDGEPSGTAGPPALAVLQGQGITNAIVVVSRYWGGTLLGTGGLVRAYGQAAKEAVAAAVVKELALHNVYTLHMPYQLLGKFQHELAKNEIEILDTVYTDLITLTVQTESKKSEAFLRLAADLSNGAVEAVFIEQGYR